MTQYQYLNGTDVMKTTKEKIAITPTIISTTLHQMEITRGATTQDQNYTFILNKWIQTNRDENTKISVPKWYWFYQNNITKLLAKHTKFYPKIYTFK